VQKTILVVDDDQVLLAMIKEGLESLNYKVITACDGLQGVLQAHQVRPDLIMLDFMMPAGGGAGVYERLRSSIDTAQIPIIFFSGATAQTVKEKIRTSPNTYFVKKPVTLEQLHTILVKVLGSSEPPPATPPKPVPATAPPAPAPAPAGVPYGITFGPPPGPAPAMPPSPFAPPSHSMEPGARTPPGRPAPAPHVFEARVLPADADNNGFLHYAAALRYFEQGRGELLRAVGAPARDLETRRKLFLPVFEVRCEFDAPCRCDESVRVQTSLSWLGQASLCFRYELFTSEAGARPACSGFTRHAVVDPSRKPVKLPEDIKALLQPHVRE
jgi:acyl-CoA thioester hydrolase